MMMMKAQPQAPVLVLWMHMLLLLTTMAALAVQAQTTGTPTTPTPTQAPTSTTPGPSPSPDPTPSPTPLISAPYLLYLYGTDLVLNAWGGSEAEAGGTNDITIGSPVQLVRNVGVPSSSALWRFRSDGTIATITSTGLLLCLDSAHRPGSDNLNQVKVWTCLNRDHPYYVNQQWTRDNITRAIMMTNTDTGYCIDAVSNGIHPFLQVAVAACNANSIGQQFRSQLIAPTQPPTPDPTQAPAPISAQYYLYVYGTDLSLNPVGINNDTSITIGSPVKLVQKVVVPSSTALWRFRSDGTITIPAATGVFLCLDSAHLAAADSVSINQVSVSTCLNRDHPYYVNQQWTWDNSTGAIIITNTGTGYCLDASINGIAQLAVALCNANSIGQRFWPQFTIPIYVYGTNLALHAWDGTNDIFSGSPVKLQENVGVPSSSALWTFQYDGTITTTTSTGLLLCLDSAHRAGSDNFNQVKVWTCLNRDHPYYVNQQWVWNRSTRTITNSGTGYCLDASINGINAAAQLAVAPCNNGNSISIGQRFETYNDFQDSTIKTN